MENKKCNECGQTLKPSQYASLKQGSQPTVKFEDKLVCRNYPKCPVSEKE